MLRGSFSARCGCAAGTGVGVGAGAVGAAEGCATGAAVSWLLFCCVADLGCESATGCEPDVCLAALLLLAAALFSWAAVWLASLDDSAFAAGAGAAGACVVEAVVVEAVASGVGFVAAGVAAEDGVAELVTGAEAGLAADDWLSAALLTVPECSSSPELATVAGPCEELLCT